MKKVALLLAAAMLALAGCASAGDTPPFAACKKGESTVSGTLPMRLFKILLVLFF